MKKEVLFSTSFFVLHLELFVKRFVIYLTKVAAATIEFISSFASWKK